MKTQYICTSCHSPSYGAEKTRGSGKLAVGLWGVGLFFLLLLGPLWAIPVLIIALVYTIWMFASKALICPSCGKPDLVSTDSPVGMEITKSAGGGDDRENWIKELERGG